MPELPTRPVLIVGSGPVGLTLALLLTKAGTPVRVIERDAGPVEQSRAIWVHSRTLEIWDGIGMAALAQGEGTEVAAIELRTDGVRRAALPYDGTGLTRFPHGLMLEQSRTQRLLLGLLAQAGGTVDWSSELSELTQHKEYCTALVTGAGGASERGEYTLVVGADGGSSTVRKALGVRLLGGTYDSAFFLADVTLEGDLPSDRATLNFHDRTTLAVLPLPGQNRFRLIGNLLDQGGESPAAGFGRAIAVEKVRDLVAANALPATISSLAWSSTYRSHHRVAETFVRQRVALAGDAAHLHSPAGGLGMNTGVADAANLAWKISEVMAGAPMRLLQTYDAERRQVAETVIRTSDRLFSLQASTHPAAAWARRTVLPRVAAVASSIRLGRRAAFVALSGTSVTYPDHVLDPPAFARSRSLGARASRSVAARLPAGGARVRAGSLFPLTQDATIDEAIAAGRGRHLLVTSTAQASMPAFGCAWSDVVVPREVLQRLGADQHSGPTLIWVRPDGYVGWIGTSSEDLGEVLGYWLAG